MDLPKFINRLLHGTDAAQQPDVSGNGAQLNTNGQRLNTNTQRQNTNTQRQNPNTQRQNPNTQGPISSSRNIFETPAWAKSVGAAAKLWSNYRSLLKNSFEQMPRAVQEDLISKICLIVTIGVTIVLLVFVYTFIPQLVREILVPLAVVGSFWLGKNVVATVVLSRYEHLLNRKF